MKQPFALPLIFGVVAVVSTLLLCQVQGGIITQQQSLTLPDALASATNETSADTKNGTKSGRVMYTASYSNVRIASKELKNLDKYFPIPAVVSKKSTVPQANIVPVLPSTSTSTTTSTTSTTTSTSTTTTTTTEAPPPSSTSESEVIPPEVEEILEIMEEVDPMNNDDEVVTETVIDGRAESDEAVTEPSLNE